MDLLREVNMLAVLQLSLRYLREPVTDSQTLHPFGPAKQTTTLEEASLCDQSFQSGQARSSNKSCQTTPGFSQQQAHWYVYFVMKMCSAS